MSSLISSFSSMQKFLLDFSFEKSTVNEKNTNFSPQSLLTITFIVTVIGIYFFKEIIKNTYQMSQDNAELFWKELKSKERKPLPPGPVYSMGFLVAPSLQDLQKEMFSACYGKSKLFSEYIEKGLTPNYLIDLGCGIGANSALLLKNNRTIKIIAIDKDPDLLEIYQSQITFKQKSQVVFQSADLTSLKQYSKNLNQADVILALDVLPYISIACWQKTMEKIVTALKPGGYFFSTVFVKDYKSSYPPNSILIANHENFGANYYPIANLAKRLIRYSGLKEIECRLRKDSIGCYEFVAQKPLCCKNLSS